MSPFITRNGSSRPPIRGQRPGGAEGRRLAGVVDAHAEARAVAEERFDELPKIIGGQDEFAEPPVQRELAHDDLEDRLARPAA